MQTTITHPFTSGNSQVVRLPKAFAFPKNTQLIMTKENDTIILKPVANLSQVPDLFAKLGQSVASDKREGEIDRSFEDRNFEDNARDW